MIFWYFAKISIKFEKTFFLTDFILQKIFIHIVRRYDEYPISTSDVALNTMQKHAIRTIKQTFCKAVEIAIQHVGYPWIKEEAS